MTVKAKCDDRRQANKLGKLSVVPELRGQGEQGDPVSIRKSGPATRRKGVPLKSKEEEKGRWMSSLVTFERSKG